MLGAGEYSQEHTGPRKHLLNPALSPSFGRFIRASLGKQEAPWPGKGGLWSAPGCCLWRPFCAHVGLPHPSKGRWGKFGARKLFSTWTAGEFPPCSAFSLSLLPRYLSDRNFALGDCQTSLNSGLQPVGVCEETNSLPQWDRDKFCKPSG